LKMRTIPLRQNNSKSVFPILRRKNGSTLVIAIWSLFLLTTFAVQLGFIVRQKLTLVHRLDNRDERYRIAESGIKFAITQLRKVDILTEADFLSEHWSDQKDLYDNRRVGNGIFSINFDYNDGLHSRVMYGMQDEESKINLNTADAAVLTRLLESTANLGAREAEELAYRIIDWRDKDSFFQHPQYGAEDSDYKGRKYSYESKDSDFEVIDELLLIDKMDQEIYDNIRNYVTVYGEGKVNINTASEPVLLALGVRNYVAKNILLFRSGGDLIPGTGDDDIFIQTAAIVPRLSQSFDLSPSELGSLSNLVAAGHFATKSENFMIRSSAKLNHRDEMTTIVAVSDRTGKIKYWHGEI